MIKTPSRLGLKASNIGLSSVMAEVKRNEVFGRSSQTQYFQKNVDSSILRTVIYDLEIDKHHLVVIRGVTEHFRKEARLIENTSPYIQKSTINNMLNAHGDRGNSKILVFIA